MSANRDPKVFAFLRQHRITGLKAVFGQLMLEDLGTQKIILLIFAVVPLAAGTSLAAAPGPERFAVVPLTLLSIVLVGWWLRGFRARVREIVETLDPLR